MFKNTFMTLKWTSSLIAWHSPFKKHNKHMILHDDFCYTFKQCFLALNSLGSKNRCVTSCVCFLKGECHAIKQDVYSNVINVCSPPNSWTFFYQKSIHTTRSSVFKGIISQNYDFMSIPMATPCCPRQTTHRVYCVSVILPNSQCWDVKNTL